MCGALAQQSLRGWARLPRNVPHPHSRVPDLPTPTRQPAGCGGRRRPAGRLVGSRLQGLARGGSRRGDCGSHLRCHRLSAPALHPRPAAVRPGSGGGCSTGWRRSPCSQYVPGSSIGSLAFACLRRASVSKHLTVKRVRGSLSSIEEQAKRGCRLWCLLVGGASWRVREPLTRPRRRQDSPIVPPR